MRHELKFKPALVTWILLLAIYWPLAFIMALLGFGMAWDGSKNWLMNAFNKIFHLTPYSMVLNWLIFSIFGGGLVLVIMRIVIVYILLICFSSCDENFEKSDLYGCYTPIGYKNNFDTIIFKAKNKFHRRVYDKNKKLILDQKGTWILKDKHTLLIESFYLNLDEDLVRFPEKLDTNFSLSTYFETVEGKIQFCIGYYIGENCFQKN